MESAKEIFDSHSVVFDGCESGFEAWVMLCSDIHFDNPKCDRSLFVRDLEKAKERNAHVFIFGDLFCAMQGRKDRRGNKGSIRAEHLGVDYFDRLVDDTAKYLGPYKDQISLITYGNHETAIVSHNETDILARLGEKLGVSVGKYSGYIFFRFRHNSKNGNRKTPYCIKTICMKYHHGSGGNSPVTKGAIKQQRRAVMYPDAQLVVSGHIHQSQLTEHSKEKVTQKGIIYQEDQVHITLPTYKNEWEPGQGWAVEKELGPTPLGCYWLRFYLLNNSIHCDIIREKKL